MSTEPGGPSGADDGFSVFGKGHGSRGWRTSKTRKAKAPETQVRENEIDPDEDADFVVSEHEFLARSKELKVIVDHAVALHPRNAQAALSELEQHDFRVEMENRAAGIVEHLVSAPFSLVGHTEGESSERRRELYVFCLILTEQFPDRTRPLTIDWDEDIARSELSQYGVSVC